MVQAVLQDMLCSQQLLPMVFVDSKIVSLVKYDNRVPCALCVVCVCVNIHTAALVK